jgi:NADH-quinone oxidoreductase subunit N
MSALLQFPPAILGFIISMILIMLVAGLFLSAWTHYAKWMHRFTLLTLLISLLGCILLAPELNMTLLSGHFVWNPLIKVFSIGLIGLSIPIFIYTNESLDGPINTRSDYYTLSLLSLFGALVMLTAGSVLSFYLGLEIMSLPLYGLVSLEAKEQLQVEAAMKYIIMGILSSILLLYGFCLLYFSNHHFLLSTIPTMGKNASTMLGQIGSGLVFAALLFKLGAVPFHFWVPDIYQSASMPTTLFIATVAKLAAIGMGLRLFLDCLAPLAAHAHFLLQLIGLLSIFGGNLVALKQKNIRRLLGYSSIAHMGFIVLGLALPTPNYAMTVFYAINYCFMSTLLLGVLAHLTQSGFEATTIHHLKGLGEQYPLAAILILLVMCSMVGIPPFIGFFSKFGILYNLLQQGFYIVGGLALIATVIGAYYTLDIIKHLYFEMPAVQRSAIVLRSSLSQAMLVISGALLISISLSPGVLLNLLEETITHTTRLPKVQTHFSIPTQ